MALIKAVNGVMPVIGENCFLADNATVVGQVTMGANCSVWFNAVVRGDVNSITIGHTTNIQDGAVIHCTYQRAATVIGNRVSIGHNAIIHGCTLEDDVLVGMGAIVMDHAVVQKGAFIAAGAIVLENTVCEAGYLYAGIPAKKIKPIDDKLRDILQRTPGNYVMYSRWFMEEA
ncbi:gamma carbonic anhydrase family protein [Rhodoflexus caldus]|uniref:gamma carbonic anhydrase family protein n=1 Tax=Rhodoflexus caldus TaxID=2891236 RepID=UPI002029D66D|nr:gamma carbonic anhydrase family protein [Rhodoflexus caldus]